MQISLAVVSLNDRDTGFVLSSTEVEAWVTWAVLGTSIAHMEEK